MHLKKIIKTKTICVCLVFFAYVSAYSNWQGAGTETDPYQIWSKAHLEELADSVNNSTVPEPYNWSTNKYFILMNDITDSVRTVIGQVHGGPNTRKAFQGNFNGNGKKIVASINSYIAGIFGFVFFAIIENFDVYGVISGEYVGGVVSKNYSSLVRNCNNYANLKATIFSGGIVGENTSRAYYYGTYITGVATVINCNNYGRLEATGTLLSGYAGICIGGIVGHSEGGDVINCINTGELYFPNSWILGGIAGHFLTSYDNGGSISNCINTGSVFGFNTVGGIGGEVSAGTIVDNNINYGFTKGNHKVGGVVGYLGMTGSSFSSGGTASNNSNFGVVVGEEDTGCIVGKNYGGTVINNHYDKQMCGEED